MMGIVNDVSTQQALPPPEPHAGAAAPVGPSPRDREQWLEPLAASGARHAEAVQRLHLLLVRASAWEARRRTSAFGLAWSSDLDDLVQQAADDALVAILARLDDFEGRSAFTTWAFKFAVHMAGVAVRRRAWRSREVPTPDESLAQLRSARPEPDAEAEQHDELRAIIHAIEQLTPRQRDVVLALCVSGVPIDVLAERLGSTRGAIYKTLHDARRSIRARVRPVAAPPTPDPEVDDA